MNAKYIILLLCFLGFFLSCKTQKVHVNNNMDYKLYVDYVQLNKYEVVDSLTMDSLLSITTREHKKITGCTASCFKINPMNEGYIIEACSTYDGLTDKDILSWTFGFSYYKEHILLVNKYFDTAKINPFKSTEEKVFVMLFSGASDITYCCFDSSCHLVESEDALRYSK